MGPDDRTDFLIRAGACFVIAWAPFVFFSSFRNHPIPAASILYSAALFAAAAIAFALIIGRAHGARRVAVFTLLVSVFLDLQTPWFDGVVAFLGTVAIVGVFWLVREHLALILLSVFTTILMTSLLGSSTDAYRDVEHVVSAHARQDGTEASGLVIHVILDGFAGLDGIPLDLEGGPALRTEIEDFFDAYGFRLYGSAISEYAASRASIASILNFEAGPAPERNYYGKRPYILKNNAYFEALHERGYGIHVYQSTYMDYCAESPVPVESCFTYRYDATDWVHSSTLSDSQKVSVLLGMLLNQSDIFESTMKVYVRLRGRNDALRALLPSIVNWDGHVSPVVTRSALDHFQAAIVDAPSGTLHFAHLLLPHGPYVYDEKCELRDDPLDWLSSHPLYERDNTGVGRVLRYEQYFAQVRCTLRSLGALFETLEANRKSAEAEIILHGDHGARIYETAPRSENQARLNAQDLADGYSTLFAIKSARPDTNAMDERQPVSLLLAETVDAVVNASALAAEPKLYLEGEDDEPWTAIPWMDRP